MDDLGDAFPFCLQYWQPDGVGQFLHLNVGVGADLSMKELAEFVANVVSCEDVIQWEDSKPDGTNQKRLDVGRLAQLGWTAKISLAEGVSSKYDSFAHEISQV